MKHTKKFFTAGYRFDKYNIVSWGEYIYTVSPGATPVAANPVAGLPGGTFLGKGQGGYVLVGYHMGDLLPRYTFAQASSEFGVVGGKTTTHTIGVNYQASPKVVAKAEVEIDVINPNTPGTWQVTQAPGSNATTGTAGYLGVDFIF